VAAAEVAAIDITINRTSAVNPRLPFLLVGGPSSHFVLAMFIWRDAVLTAGGVTIRQDDGGYGSKDPSYAMQRSCRT
jgi:hypothetical protein